MAGETVTPGTEARDVEAVWMTALSAFEANTSIAGTEKSGSGDLVGAGSPGSSGLRRSCGLGGAAVVAWRWMQPRESGASRSRRRPGRA